MSSTSLDHVPQEIIEQRKRFEALGLSINKGNKMASWLKVLYVFALIILIPTVLLLNNPLKDFTAFMFQAIAYGFRILIAAMTILLTSRMAREIYAAKNDFEKKLSTIGYNDPEKNTKEEISLLRRKFIYSLIFQVSIIAGSLGIFLVSNRTNVSYIAGSEVILFVIIVSAALTWRFWVKKGDESSPRLGGRLLVLQFLPAVFLWGVELILEFFSVLAQPNFDYNILQLTYSTAYPVIFIFIFLAVAITTKKTKREKIKMQTEKEQEIARRSKFIEDKNFLNKIQFKVEYFWNQLLKSLKIKRKPKIVKEENLDKKPSLVLVRSIWIALFITVIPMAFLISWNLFPHDGLLIFISLIVAYEYSMMKYDRYKIDAIGLVHLNTEKEPPKLRKPELSNYLNQSLMLVTIVFITIALIVGPAITKGNYEGYNGMIIISFTWVSVILAIPLSIRLLYYIKQGFDENREPQNIKLMTMSLIPILIIEVSLVLGMFGANIFLNSLGLTFISPAALYLLGAIIGVAFILPSVYIFVAPRMKTDKSYKIYTITTFVLQFLVISALFVWFIFDVVLRFFG